METFKSHPLLEVSDEQVNAIRTANGMVNLESMNKDIGAVLEWFAKESHLPDIKLDRIFIESVYMNRKCSLEQTKKKIDMLFTMKSLMPTYFSPRDPLGPIIQSTKEAIYCVPLPKLLPDNTRVTFISNRTKETSGHKPMEILRYINLMIEYRMHKDYSAGDRIVCDMKLSSYANVLKYTPTFINDSLTIFQQCYGSRLFSCHLINAPPYIGRVVSLLKAFVSTKLGTRITVHDSLDDLFKVVPKAYMPKDFGGDAPSVDELADAWLKELRTADNRKFILETEAWKSDESKRIGGQKTTEMFGLEGSFRKLDVF